MNEAILIILALLGLAAHFLKKLAEVKASTGQIISPRQYYLANPYTSLSAIVLCAVGLALLWGTDELTRITAFTFGYMADSAITAIVRRQQ